MFILYFNYQKMYKTEAVGHAIRFKPYIFEFYGTFYRFWHTKMVCILPKKRKPYMLYEYATW